MGSEENAATGLLHLLVAMGICITITVIVPLAFVTIRTVKREFARRGVSNRSTHGRT